jgi:signal transduction histidine kinase/CheY-like chemotaxis protein
VLLGHRVRVAQLHARQRELTALVAERTRSLVEEKERTERERERAEEASRAKSTFLASMSHELRTPLNAILGFVQLMERERGRTAEDREHLAIVSRSGEHLLGLINDVLSLSKIEAGKMTLQPVPLDLAALVGDVAGLVRPRAEARGIALRLEVAPSRPRWMRADEGKLRQVLLNLLGNAVKFTASGGVTLRAAGEDGLVAFEVEDTGPGMTPEELEGLFETFAQTEHGRQAKEGTGLGLVISRNIARLMGGDVTARSEPGHGSVFRLAVPLFVATAEEVEARARARGQRVVGLAGAGPPPVLLIADDVAENRLLLQKLLSAVGFRVLEARDGEEALRIWRGSRPALLLMDVRMPGMDGLTAARLLREEETREGRDRTAVVALSASVFEHERAAVLAAGFDDFLMKPFTEAVLFEMLAARLGVRFRTEEAPPAAAARAPEDALTAERLGRLAPELREDLYRALAMGDDAAAAGVAARAREQDAALAEALGAALRSFQLERVQRLVEEVR